jgi:serine-type D-Ala-D-Ala carboxypeptidase (penicillin-binding protein 5/6)
MALLGRLGRRLLPLASVLVAVASLVPARPAAAVPATQAPQAYILVDADNGCIRAAKDEHQSLLTASTVKLLTAITALERLPLDSTVPVSARAANQPAMKINMHEGEVWTLDDAIHSMLIVSANDAAYAIAERTGGSVEQFAKLANVTAKQLGATDTNFADPAGLDDRNAYAGGSHMSAYGLAVVARNALAIPEIANAAKTLDYDFTDPTGAGRHLRNHNDGFLTTYAGATGLKTGYTKAASRTLVTSATRDGRTMIAVVMGTWDDTGWAGSLLDQGFTTPAGARCSGAQVPPVRAVTADTRGQAFAGLPPVLGTPSLGGAGAVAAVAGTTETSSTTTPKTKTKATTTAKASGAKHSNAATIDAQAVSVEKAATQPGSSGLSLGTILSVWNFVLVVFLALLALFLLRRRAVRRQRVRRMARQKRMEEIRRRRMIDLVEPSDRASHVRVVPRRARSRAR